MEQPQRIDALEKQYSVLLQRVDRLDHTEKKHDFTIRDSAVKIGIAEGLAESTHREISQLKLEIIQVQAALKELRFTSDQNFEDIHKKLDTQGDLLRQVLARIPE
jgi:hypothetical protein